MTQYWTVISLADGSVLAPCFATASYGQHPKDAGWDWKADEQRAIRIAAPPDPIAQIFNGQAWEIDMVIFRARRWQEVKAARDRAQDAGCSTATGRVDTDTESRGKISGAVQLAMLAQMAGDPFEIAWTMQNNSTVMHDASAMIAMGVAAGRHVAACHAVALTKRTAIEAAVDVAAIEAIDITEGWPDAPTA